MKIAQLALLSAGITLAAADGHLRRELKETTQEPVGEATMDASKAPPEIKKTMKQVKSDTNEEVARTLWFCDNCCPYDGYYYDCCSYDLSYWFWC